MTAKDKKNIRSLFYIHRYNETSISKLFGVTQQRISIILKEQQSVTFAPLQECLLCGLDDGVKSYFIDGDEENNKPQNVIILCENDKRKIEHLQIKRGENLLITQY